MRSDKEFFIPFGEFGEFGEVRVGLVAERDEEYVVRVENTEYRADAIIPKNRARLVKNGICVQRRLFLEDVDVAFLGILLRGLLKEVSE